VLAVIILPFALWGVDSYQRSGNVPAPATVDGAKVTQQEFDLAIEQQRDRLRQMLGASFDATMFDNPEMKRAVLDNLVAQRLLLERAKKAGFVVSDEQLVDIIRNIAAFQENGKFDKKLYESALASKGMSPAMFEAKLAEDVLAQQSKDAYVQGGFASKKVAAEVLRLNEQQRLVSVVELSAANFQSQIKVSDVDVAKYYDEHRKDFEVAEQVRLEYVKFSPQDVASSIQIKDEDVTRFYEEHQSEYGEPEQRRASHILIAVDKSAPQVELDAAKKKAANLLAQVKKDPAKFAELAKLNSQDPGSASSGGDLGFFTKGMMVKSFDDSVFSLKQGEISDLVQSDFGYHIIRLVSIKAGQAKPLSEMREVIVGSMRQQKSMDRFAELAEQFSNAVYEQSDTLKPAAQLVGGKIEQSGWLSKGAVALTPWTDKMMQAVFTEDVLTHKRNTPAIEVEPSVLLSARMVEYKPAFVRPLTEVAVTVKARLSQQRALELAEQQGKAILAKLQAGEQAALSWMPALAVTRARHEGIAAEVVRQIFQADSTKLPAYVGTSKAGVGYLLVRINAVKHVEREDAERTEQYAQQIRQLVGEEMFRAYLDGAKKEAKIEINLVQEPAQQ
jgi:peptidyl-prolyl cis-trans isomerase D